MKATVAICTWNRAESLKRTLESVAAMPVPSGIEWEVLVVDNNSSDNTKAVAGSFSDRLPIRTVFEATQGLSNARNAAARAARGEYILWTDDDVIVGPGWLAGYCAAFAQYPNAAIFGGRVDPVFEPPVPEWLAQGWRIVPSAFAGIDLGASARPLSAEELPYGANFALRREELLDCLFDPKLGASPKGKYYAEETTVMQKMLSQGIEGWWLTGIPVQHCIPRERMSLDYIKNYFFRVGRTDYYLRWGNQPEKKFRLLGRPLWVWKSLAKREFVYWMTIAQPIERRLIALRNRSHARGVFNESRRV